MDESTRQFICFLEPARKGMPTAPTPEEAQGVLDHFAYYTRLRDEGALILAGRTQEAPFVGVFIFEAPTPDDAERIVRQDPGVARGVFRASVQPYKIALQRGS